MEARKHRTEGCSRRLLESKTVIFRSALIPKEAKEAKGDTIDGYSIQYY